MSNSRPLKISIKNLFDAIKIAVKLSASIKSVAYQIKAINQRVIINIKINEYMVGIREYVGKIIMHNSIHDQLLIYDRILKDKYIFTLFQMQHLKVNKF